jgi:hypothetical protein
MKIVDIEGEMTCNECHKEINKGKHIISRLTGFILCDHCMGEFAIATMPYLPLEEKIKKKINEIPLSYNSNKFWEDKFLFVKLSDSASEKDLLQFRERFNSLQIQNSSMFVYSHYPNIEEMSILSSNMQKITLVYPKEEKIVKLPEFEVKSGYMADCCICGKMIHGLGDYNSSMKCESCKKIEEGSKDV